MLKNVGLSDDNSYGVLSSLSEVINNSFFHNLGLWEISFGPLCNFLGQNYPREGKLSFVISDLGVGFKRILSGNYPELKNEEESKKKALSPMVTGRYQNKGGNGNGLVYLQKNIFNGFRGKLFIRSNDTLVEVKSFGEIEIIKLYISTIGTTINFTLFY